jgi:glycosyltransferase involved in cell wall biosynthesis
MVSVLRSWGHEVHLVALDIGFSEDEKRDTATLVDDLQLIPWNRHLDPYGLPQASNLAMSGAKKFSRGIRKVLGNWPPALDPDLEDRCPAVLREAVRAKALRIQPIAVVAVYIWLSRCLEYVPANVHKVIDTIDLMHQRLLQYRGAGLHSFFQCSLEDELRCLRRADTVLLIQEQECALLRQHLPGEMLLTCPHGHEIHARNRGPGAKRLLFVGAAHAANVEGLAWFLKHVWPLVQRADPDVRLSVAGAAGTAIQTQPEYAALSRGIDVLGYVEDLTSLLLNSDVMINPILRGSGLKIKAVEALCCGLPVVSTAKGVEGIASLSDCPAVVVADEPAAFSQKVLEVLNSKSDLGRAATEFSAVHFSVDAAYRGLRQRLDRLARQ